LAADGGSSTNIAAIADSVGTPLRRHNAIIIGGDAGHPELLTVDLVDKADDSAAVTAFREAMRSSLESRFAIGDVSSANHPFIVATVLDPAIKNLPLFSHEFRTAAYAHVRSLLQPVTAASSVVTAGSSGSATPPVKKAKTDVRATTLKFLSSSLPHGPSIPEFNRYIAASVDDNIDALQWWALNESKYSQTAAVARQYLSVPATSVLSERQFSAAGRLVPKLRSRLDPERVDTLIFLYENM